MRWPQVLDCRAFFGPSRDLRTRAAADRYIEKLWQARVRLRESLTAARKRRSSSGYEPGALLRRQAG